MRRLHPFVLCSALLVLPSGCNEKPLESPAPASGSVSAASSADAAGDVLATVNGVPIRVSDLHYVLARERGPAGKAVDKARAAAVLDEIIAQEIARQRAEKMGLDDDPEYLRRLRFMQAPVNDFERSALTDAFYKAEADKAKVSEDEARRHFEQHKERYQTEVRVHQILIRDDEQKVQDLKARLDGGAAFEQVASTLFPDAVAAGAKPPWEVGPLRWNQVPEYWVGTLEGMKQGEVSDIVRGPRNRAWILKLVERKRNEDITFDKARADLIRTLQRDKVAALRKQTEERLRKEAEVVYVRDPGSMPPPPEPED